MLHTISAPMTIKDPFFEGQLSFVPRTNETSQRGESIPEHLPPAGPRLSLGQPQCWNLAKLTREKGSTLPAEMALLLRNADFYLLQLAYSFRPEPKSEVVWARLNVDLQPMMGKDFPIVFDIYPREIYEVEKKDWKVSIAPSLKFSVFEGVDIDAKLGEAVTTIEFRKLEPVIVGYGLLQSNPSWDIEKHREHPIRGVKSNYIIVKKPHGAEAVLLTIALTVDVVTQHGLLRARVNDKDQARLCLVVCED